MIVSTDAVILRGRRYGETSRIVTLYTRERGKLSAIAKGARGGGKPGRAVVLDPAGLVRAVLYIRESREVQLLSQCDQIEPLGSLRSDLPKMGAAMGIVELTDLVTPPGEAFGELFDLLADTLRHLDRATSNAENALYFYEVRLLGLLGFRPDLHHCVGCRRVLGDEPQGGGEGDARIGASGIVCPRCAAGHRGLLAVSRPGVRVLQRMQDVESVEPVLRIALPPPVRSELARILHLLMQSHVAGYRVLKSQEVFAAIAGA